MCVVILRIQESPCGKWPLYLAVAESRTSSVPKFQCRSRSNFNFKLLQFRHFCTAYHNIWVITLMFKRVWAVLSLIVKRPFCVDFVSTSSTFWSILNNYFSFFFTFLHPNPCASRLIHDFDAVDSIILLFHKMQSRPL